MLYCCYICSKQQSGKMVIQTYIHEDLSKILGKGTLALIPCHSPTRTMDFSSPDACPKFSSKALTFQQLNSSMLSCDTSPNSKSNIHSSVYYILSYQNDASALLHRCSLLLRSRQQRCQRRRQRKCFQRPSRRKWLRSWLIG